MSENLCYNQYPEAKDPIASSWVLPGEGQQDIGDGAIWLGRSDKPVCPGRGKERSY